MLLALSLPFFSAYSSSLISFFIELIYSLLLIFPIICFCSFFPFYFLNIYLLNYGQYFSTYSVILHHFYNCFCVSLLFILSPSYIPSFFSLLVCAFLLKMCDLLPASGGVCSQNQFACSTGECVGLDKRCDQNYDCLDRSDERGCPSTG